MKINKELMKQYQKDYRVTHTQLVATIPNDLATKLKMQLKKDGMSYTKFLKISIQEYLDGKKL